jgi:hypothetical protein
VEGLGADNVVLFLLENPELLPRVPAKPTPNSRLSPELTTTDGRGGCNRGTAVEEPRNSGSGRPVGRCERKRGAIAQVEEEEVVELTAARAPCEPASRSRSAATTSCSGCPRGEEDGWRWPGEEKETKLGLRVWVWSGVTGALCKRSLARSRPARSYWAPTGLFVWHGPNSRTGFHLFRERKNA